MIQEHLAILVTWLIYYGLHSFLISDWMKVKVQKTGVSLHVWRVIYSILSTIGFVLLFYWMAIVESIELIPNSNWLRFLAMVSTTYGVILGRIAFRNYSLMQFLSKDDRFIESELITNGIQSKIRHPLYSATILIFVGFFLFIPKMVSLVAMVAMLLYLPVGIYFEERKLVKKFGEDYLEYRKRVPPLIPKFFH